MLFNGKVVIQSSPEGVRPVQYYFHQIIFRRVRRVRMRLMTRPTLRVAATPTCDPTIDCHRCVEAQFTKVHLLTFVLKCISTTCDRLHLHCCHCYLLPPSSHQLQSVQPLSGSLNLGFNSTRTSPQNRNSKNIFAHKNCLTQKLVWFGSDGFAAGFELSFHFSQPLNFTLPLSFNFTTFLKHFLGET